MKKVLIIIFCFLFLVGCVGMSMDKSVIRKNNIKYTLESYDTYVNKLGGWEKQGNSFLSSHSIKETQDNDESDRALAMGIVFLWGVATGGLLWVLYPVVYPFVYVATPDYTTLAEPQIIDCRYLNDDSDECILFRRTHDYRNSKVAFFDYKRFLPKDANIKTDEDFLYLVNAYHKYEKQRKKCYNDVKYEETSDEKEKRIDDCLKIYGDVEKRLNDYIYQGGLEKEKAADIEARAKRKAERARKKAEQARKEAEMAAAREAAQRQEQEENERRAKRRAADCEQAKQKAEAMKLKIMAEYDTDQLVTISGGYVVGLSDKNDGIFVVDTKIKPTCNPGSGCSFIGWPFFLYTDHMDYHEGQWIGSDYLCVPRGNYKYKRLTGETGSVPAYKLTKYETPLIDYHYYGIYSCD